MSDGVHLASSETRRGRCMVSPRAHLGVRLRAILGATGVVLGLMLAPAHASAVEQAESAGVAALEAAAPKPANTGKFWDRVRFGMVAHFYTGLGEIRSTAANFIIFPDIAYDSGTIVLEPRVGGDGRVILSPLVTPDPDALSTNFAVSNTLVADPRPDTGGLQNNAVEEDIYGTINFGYDFKTWKHGTLSVQLDYSYYTGPVGNIEVAVDLAEAPILNPDDQDPAADDPFTNFQFIYPSAGELTQAPISLSGVWQFRPRSPLRPYLGGGVGYLDVTLSDSESLDAVNADLAGIDFTWEGVRGVLPAATVTATTESGPMYLLQGGLEYNVNRRWSVYLDTRYLNTNARVVVRGLDQVRFGTGILRTTTFFDVEGLSSEADLVETLLDMTVEEGVALLEDIESNDEAIDNGASPVFLGDAIRIQIPNPIAGEDPITIERTTKLMVEGGDISLDSYSVGFGFRYRF